MAGGSGGGGLLGAARLEGQAGCKTERLHTLSTPLGPYDKNYSRKRLREHSLERTDCECFPPETPSQRVESPRRIPDAVH